LLLLEAAKRLTAQGVEFELVLAGDGEMRAEAEQSSPIKNSVQSPYHWMDQQ